MRKFENIKPLSQVSYRKREIPEYEIGGFFKTVSKPFIQLGTWTKNLFTTDGQNTNKATVTNTASKTNTTSKPASVATPVKTSTSNVTTQDSTTKSTTSNVGVNQNVSSTSTQRTSAIASTIPVPPSTEEIAKSNLTKQSNPDNATSAIQAIQTTKQERNEVLEQARNNEAHSMGTKAEGVALKNTGSHIAGMAGGLNQGMKAIGASTAFDIGTTALSMLNPGPQTNLRSDANINAGLDAAASIAGTMGTYGKIAEFGIKGLQTVGNFVAGNIKPKFHVDKDLQARQGASYMDTFRQVEKLSQGPGIMGIFGGGWRDKWQDAKAQYELTKDIDNRGQDAAAASRYEGIGLQNEMALNGGYTSLRAAKNGMKISSLKFARKAASGLRFNSFKMQEGEGINLTNKNINPNNLQNKNPEDKLTKAIREAGGVNYTDNAGNTHVRVASNLLKTYKPSEIQEWYTKNHPQITVDWNLHSSSGIEDADLLNDEWWDKNKEVILQNANEWWKSEDVKANNSKADNFSEIERIVAKMSDLNYQLTSEEENILTKAGYKKGTDGLWYDPSKLESKKQGGVFTFFPATEDEEIQFFKEGGSFNVIPDGALHKNKHHIEDTEGLTQKGIPVVTEEVEGKLVQQAEIEINEIIFRLEVTNKLEELAKEGTDEAAIEAGKLLVKEILHNTHDNTGLINEISI